MKYDFSGWATKNDLLCTDGRTIRRDAFKDNHGGKVPLVWQHGHSDPENVLGHALLENRKDGVYAYCVFNDTPKAQHVKTAVMHGDIRSLSIWANQLKQKGGDVLHGVIRELSLVLSGANKGATIDNLYIEHSDGTYGEGDEAIICTDEPIALAHSESEESALAHADDGGEKTVQDVFDSMTEEQKNVVYALIGNALADKGGEMKQSDEGGEEMKTNVFDRQPEEDKTQTHLTHDQLREIIKGAEECGSFKKSFLAHAQAYGIENIDILFPDAKTITPTPDMISRDMEWVSGIISGTRHVPYSRIKSTAADITAEEARARGYIKGNLKKEEVIKLLKRTTSPTTIYKKQKLDRDDIIDITDLDVVAFLKAEMRLMLDEEIARAIMLGDGRDISSEDKIKDPAGASEGAGIRAIYHDDDLYAHHVAVEAASDTEQMIEDIIRSRKHYKGSGSPTLYMPGNIITDMLLLKDKIGRRYYNTETELASALRVSRIVEIPLMEGAQRTEDTTKLDLIGIMVNLKDYAVGTDRGGAISMFDDFDIDYNQYKYLMETRCSGALTKPKSALIIEKKVAVAG